MPEYCYQCRECGYFTWHEYEMDEEKPGTAVVPHDGCDNKYLPRKFTIPGMFIAKPEEDGGWMVRAPGQVQRDRRESFKHATDQQRRDNQERRANDDRSGDGVAQGNAHSKEGGGNTP